MLKSAEKNSSSGYFLVGPTASGKSSISHYLAEQFRCAIVSSDSMNLYKGMDIGTAKPSKEEREMIPYFGVDLVEPIEKFSVARYLDAVKPAFESSSIPIVCGGTGLYIKCLTEGFSSVPPENKILRSKLELLSVNELQEQAESAVPLVFSALTIDDKQNPRRLIRILEKAIAGTDFSKQKTWNKKSKPTLVGLCVERKLLHQRIAERVKKMYDAGLLEEAKQLSGKPLSPTALQAIGYAEAFGVLNNELTLDEAKERTIIRTRQLAKRQMTWFRNQLNVEWIDTALFPTKQELAEAILKAWKKSGPTLVRT